MTSVKVNGDMYEFTVYAGGAIELRYGGAPWHTLDGLPYGKALVALVEEVSKLQGLKKYLGIETPQGWGENRAAWIDMIYVKLADTEKDRDRLKVENEFLAKRLSKALDLATDLENWRRESQTIAPPSGDNEHDCD